MSNPQKSSSSLKIIDTFYDEIANDTNFIDFVQSPKYANDLRSAVELLILTWPKLDQIEALEKNIKEHYRRHFNLNDKRLLDNLKLVHTLNIIRDYNSDNQTSQLDAILYSVLVSRRPQGLTFYKKFDNVEGMDSIMSHISLITKQ